VDNGARAGLSPEELRERGELFNEALGRESYEAGAGHKATTDFAGIFEAFADVASPAALEAARGHGALFEWVTDSRVGRRVAALDDRLHAWEASALVTLEDGARMPWQQVGIAIGNEPRREVRRMLERSRRAVLGEPAAIRAERLALERELLAEVNPDYVCARSELSGIDLDALAAQSGAFLADTREVYRELLRERLAATLGIGPGEAERQDAAWLFRVVGFDDVFPGGAMVDTARRQVGEMGLDVENGGRIHLDTAERERKRPRAFCAPVRVPDEVYLVIRPHGGYADYRAFWHELGHALHFSSAERELLFEHRWLGDNSVTEAWAMLFEHQLVNPLWLERYAELGGARREEFLRSQAFATLAIVRRYAAKLRYEIGLHRAPSLGAGAGAYAELLTDATGFRYADEDALLDLDDGFYSARYLRAWQFEAMLRRRLVERLDEDWFRNPRSGPFVQDLLARGQRQDAAALAAKVLDEPLGFASLVAEIEKAL
jgi:hypothetical protein